MRVNMQWMMGNATYSPSTFYHALYYMSGVAPTTLDAVKAVVDLSDSSDLHSKSVGVSLVKSTVALDTTGMGSYSQTFTLSGAYRSWLKNGFTKQGSYYIPTPSRFYYTNGRKATLFSLPPNLFSMPVDCISNATVMSTYTTVNHVDSAPTTLAYLDSGNNIDYTIEYDNDTTISAIRVSVGAASPSSSYIYTADVYYWNSSTSLWVAAYTGRSLTANSDVTTLTFAAVTSTKFRVVLYPYKLTAGYPRMFIGGVALMSTISPSIVSVPDITWGIIIPFPVPASSAVIDMYYDQALPSLDPNLNNITGRGSGTYQKSNANMPAIIDTCGQTGSSKMVITQSSNLTSEMRPTLAAYKYYLGELI